MYNKSIKEFNDLLSLKKPIPGGGSSSALSGSLAASLANMAIEFTYGKQKYLEYEKNLNLFSDELLNLRNKLLDTINDDCDAYSKLNKFYSLHKKDPKYLDEYEFYLQKAAMPPLSTMKYCSRIIEINLSLITITSKMMLSDLGTSLSLALGALDGAYLNVLVNTKLMNDKDYSFFINLIAKKLLDKYSKLAFDAYKEIVEKI